MRVTLAGMASCLLAAETLSTSSLYNDGSDDRFLVPHPLQTLTFTFHPHRSQSTKNFPTFQAPSKMFDQESKGKAPKVREIFAEDYDEDVVDYESGLRRQALRVEREKNQTSGSRNDVVIIHLEPTHPTKPETSTSAFPDTERKRSGISSITHGLKRMLSKKSKKRPSVASKDSIPTPTQSEDEAEALILKGDISILMETNPAILRKAEKAAKRVKLARKRRGILATDKVCAKLKEEFSDAPSAPMRRQGFVGGEEVVVALREEFRLETSPPKSFEESEESSDSLYSQKCTVSEQQDDENQPESPIDPMM